MKSLLPIAFAGVTFAAGSALAQEFRFEAYPGLEDMRAHLQTAAPVGAPRESIQAMLVGGGRATLHRHPDRPDVEKYVYTINLCRLYVWEWNISADYSPAGRLVEIYVNGEPVHSQANVVDPESVTAAPGAEQSIWRGIKRRPEADRGESEIVFAAYDRDGSTDTITDQLVIVGGPSRADPRSFGMLHAYSAERWRSIVDEVTGPVVNYQNCPG